MNTYFESAKAEVLKDLKQLMIEIEGKKEVEFLRLLMHYKNEDDPQVVALYHLLFISDERLNKYLKTL
jgi:hypothetical protein